MDDRSTKVPVDCFVENHPTWFIIISDSLRPDGVAATDEFLLNLDCIFSVGYAPIYDGNALHLTGETSCSRCSQKHSDSFGFLICGSYAEIRRTIPLNCSCVVDLIQIFPDLMSPRVKSAEAAILRGLRQLASGRQDSSARLLNVIKVCLPLVTEDTVVRIAAEIDAINSSCKEAQVSDPELWLDTAASMMELLHSHPNVVSYVKPAK